MGICMINAGWLMNCWFILTHLTLFITAINRTLNLASSTTLGGPHCKHIEYMSWGSLSTKDESRFCEFIWRLTMWHIAFVTPKTHPSRTSQRKKWSKPTNWGNRMPTIAIAPRLVTGSLWESGLIPLSCYWERIPGADDVANNGDQKVTEIVVCGVHFPE